MPLREDLLEPIEGELPSGPDLRYDKVFDQIKEARIEEDDSLPSGDWGRAAKKADRVLVIKLGGETLAKRSKDLRLAGWYLESLIRKEGFGQLPGGLELLHKLQSDFWDTLHPEREDDGNLDLRIGAVETAATLIAASLKVVPLTRSGFNLIEYQDAKAIGFETSDMSDDKAAARREALSSGKATGEDLQRAIDATSKAYYVDLAGQLTKSLQVLDELDAFDEEKYGDDYPSLTRLKSAIEEVQKVVGIVLSDKRKTEPDAVVEEDKPEVEEATYGSEPEANVSMSPVTAAAPRTMRREAPVGAPTDTDSAYLQVAACAEFLWAENSSSAVPYLLCTALRLGETRSANLTDESFAVAPMTEIRQAMRRMANEEKWGELMQLCLRTLPEPCGRVWLDLQRYVWRAAQGIGNENLASAVVSTVRSMLTDFPAMRTVTLDDDTSAANPETQQWIDSQVMQS